MTRVLLLLALGLLLPGTVAAQEAWRPVQGSGVDLWRMRQALQADDPGGFLLRAPSRDLAQDSALGDPVRIFGATLRVAPLPTELTWVWNSALPRSTNDGVLWAGRGSNLLLRVGAAVAWGPVRMALAPEVAYSQNRPFPVFPSPDEDRSDFASPWHTGVHSMDLPLRFGTDRQVVVGPGQSSIQVVAGPGAVGFATENVWWGPGIRNALVLSNQAPGFPHVFLRTRRPVGGSWGSVEAEWIAGTLTESLYFDRDPDNDHRSLAGLAVVYRPPLEDELAFGLARTVIRPLDDPLASPLRLPDALYRWNEKSESEGEPAPSDHVTSVFVRWLPAGSGLDVFAEWAWTEVPGSLSALLTRPQDTRGYTLGFQWTRALDAERQWVRVEVEATNLERALSRRDGSLPPDFYAGDATPHGFTHRGQLLGAAVGPGGQSQWLAVDYFEDGWSAGALVNRVRWEDDALFRQTNRNFWRHDVSLLGGLRGSWRTGGLEVRGEAILGRRHNYLFQNGRANPAGIRTVDVENHTVSLSVVHHW